MANTKQAKKRARQAVKRNRHNAPLRSAMRTAIKGVRKAISEKNYSLAMDAYREASSRVDKMASKGHIHQNKANRYKSRLNAHVKALQA